MKKFMKAIAFVTVMCLAFSTVAFAAGTPVLDEEAEKVLNITVTGAGDDEVALVVVASDATDLSNPLYVDQQTSASDTASFRAVLTNAEVEAVDIYVGYAAYANSKASYEKIGEDIRIVPVTNVTISNVACTWADYKGEGMEQNATGAVLSFDFVAPEGVTATQMVWKITYVGDEGNETVYSEVYDITGYGLGSLVASGTTVKLGLAFLNGSDKNNVPIAEIVDISAIFLFEGGVLGYENEGGGQTVTAANAAE